MYQYLKLLDNVLTNGIKKNDRTGVGTFSIFGYQMRFQIGALNNYPLLTTKKVHFKSIAYELLWMLNGKTNIKYLNDNGVTIWDEWADANGELGFIYGHQWRYWNYKHDQIANVIRQIKTNPNSRRHIVSAWNVGDLNCMALPPCHVLFQFYVEEKTKQLSCQVYQRSADVFLGVPFNIASYALLLKIIAAQTNLTPKELIWTGGDVHLYFNHIEQAKIQLKRNPLPLPILEIINAENIEAFTYGHFRLKNYHHHQLIKADIAI